MSTSRAQPTKQPNIVFVFADQMRQSLLEGEQVQIPNLAAFAQEGMAFSRAISNTPVCCPARASILTGLHTLNHEVVFNDKALRTDLKSIAHCLNEDGYSCGYIGKWHLDCEDRGVFVPPGPRRQGFDDFWAAYNCNHDYFNAYYYLNDDPEPHWIDGYEPFKQTELAVEYIQEKVQQESPFCLFVSFGTPHCPYRRAPQDYLDMYPEDEIVLKPNVSDDVDKAAIAGYYAHVTALDDCFGSILDSIEDSGVSDDTIVVFTSDHGDMLFSQGRGWKCKPWAESVGIPFLVRWPGHVPAGSTSNSPVSLVDVMPTLLALAGCDKAPEHIDGVDLSDLFLGNKATVQPSVFINMPVVPKAYSFTEWRGIVTERYTYARFRDTPWVLYDDRDDPYQMRNLANSPEHQALQTQLEEQLNGWLEKLGDPFASSDTVAEELYKGSQDCMMPFYENDIIRSGKGID